LGTSAHRHICLRVVRQWTRYNPRIRDLTGVDKASEIAFDTLMLITWAKGIVDFIRGCVCCGRCCGDLEIFVPTCTVKSVTGLDGESTVLPAQWIVGKRTEATQGKRHFIGKVIMVHVSDGSFFADSFAGHEGSARHVSVVTTAGVQKSLLSCLHPVSRGVGAFIDPIDSVPVQGNSHQRGMPRRPQVFSSACSNIIHSVM